MGAGWVSAVRDRPAPIVGAMLLTMTLCVLRRVCQAAA